jgi:hypothetical protein
MTAPQRRIGIASQKLGSGFFDRITRSSTRQQDVQQQRGDAAG